VSVLDRFGLSVANAMQRHHPLFLIDASLAFEEMCICFITTPSTLDFGIPPRSLFWTFSCV
jgi:hypothetical protein